MSEPSRTTAPEPVASDASAASPRSHTGATPAPRRGFLAGLGHRDHTQGNLLASVLVLSLPAVSMSVLGMGTFQMVDLAFLGRLGDNAIAAAGATNQIFRQFFMHMAWGVSAAVTMRVAQYVGGRSVGDAEHAAGQGLLVGISLGFFCALTVGTFPEPFVSLIASPEVVPEAVAYARVLLSFFGIMLCLQMLNAVLMGAGDTATPMLISFAQVPVAIAAQWVLAFGNLGAPALGVRGMAAGYLIGGAVALSLSLWAIGSGRCRVHLRARHLRPDGRAILDLFRNGWQPAVHLMARSVLIWIFMWLSGQLGSKVQAAYVIGLRVEMVMVMIAFPIANSCATLVGQNLGAGNIPRAWQAIRSTAVLELSIMLPVSVFVFFARGTIVTWFTADAEVAALASEYLMFVSFALSFAGLYFTAFRSLQGAGDMNTPMLISVGLALCVGAPLALWLSAGSLGATGMWIANTVYAIANCLIMGAWLLTGRWTHRHAPTNEAPALP